MAIKKDDEKRLKAREMYLASFSIKDIAKELVKLGGEDKRHWERKCYYWKKKDEWDKKKYRKEELKEKQEDVKEKYINNLLNSEKITPQDMYALSKVRAEDTSAPALSGADIKPSDKGFYPFLQEQLKVVQAIFEEKTSRKDLVGIEDAAKVLERLQKMFLKMKECYIEFAGAFMLDLDEFCRNKGIFGELSEHIFDFKDYVLDKYRNMGEENADNEDQ